MRRIILTVDLSIQHNDDTKHGRNVLFRHFLYVCTKRISNAMYASTNKQLTFFFLISLFHRAFRFTKFYLYQRMHLFLSYTKIT